MTLLLMQTDNDRVVMIFQSIASDNPQEVCISSYIQQILLLYTYPEAVQCLIVLPEVLSLA